MRTFVAHTLKWHINMPWNQQVFQIRLRAILVSLLFAIVAVLLAKFALFEHVTPFFFPFWTVVHLRYPKFQKFVLAGGLVGSTFLGFGQLLLQLAMVGTFFLTSKRRLRDLFLPFQVGVIVLGVQFVWQYVSYVKDIPISVITMVGYESLLAALFTIFLSQVIVPVYELTIKKWTIERTVSAVVIGVVVWWSMEDIQLFSVSLSLLVSQFLLLAVYYTQGKSRGAFFAICVGVVSTMTTLAFSGMLAVYALTAVGVAIVKNKSRVGISTGMLGSYGFMLLYDDTLPLDEVFFTTFAVASLLFLLFPKDVLDRWAYKGASEETRILLKRQEWMSDKMKEQLAKFQSFIEFLASVVGAKDVTVAATLDTTVGFPACTTCFKRNRCWANGEDGMVPVVQEWRQKRPVSKKGMKHQLNRSIQEKCVRAEQVIEALEESYTTSRLANEYVHGSQMMALQLKEIGQHVGKLLADLELPTQLGTNEEELLCEMFAKANVPVIQLDIVSTEKGAHKLVVCLPHATTRETTTLMGERVVLPILHAHFDEPFHLAAVNEVQHPFSHVQLICESTVRFEYSYSICATSKEHTLYSGDTHLVFPLHEGLVAVILSDGMGHNKDAYMESKKVIRLLRECLQYPMSPESAMHTLHYLMSLKLGSDLYATVDLALIDLQHGKLWSYKAGSMATYLFSGPDVTLLENFQAPIGMLGNIQMENRTTMLKDGDTLVFVSDGLFSSQDDLALQEKELIRLVRKYAEIPVSMQADRIVADFKRRFGAPEDDCTIILLQIRHTVPEWSSFSPFSVKSWQKA
ncbi:SpoIIE family protein phosphatase [Paenisporosarcina cavernae]|uniref:Stage II sporulation protein E n=1 Tax=Paenisporosarcina cavernae TaxID=2320858 RepID=A0A385YUW9_9BACL|nr:SpoIIE family protein phosphatase [Paenisporosarcina cavernae]AYC30685.1 stage II sporulation protein E [Paenisporosarcina cavernae]